MGIRNKDIAKRYRESVRQCELDAIIGCCQAGWLTSMWRTLEQHHIVGGPYRDDVETNLLMICRESHMWVQSKEVIAGRIVCLAAKMNGTGLDWGWFQQRGCGCQHAWIERRWPDQSRPILFGQKDVTIRVAASMASLEENWQELNGTP